MSLRPHIQSSLLAFVCMGAVVGGMYLMIRRMSFKAKGPTFSSPNYVVFIESFNDLAQPDQKASLGFGSTAILKDATDLLSEAVSSCRQYKTAKTESYRFDVKVSPHDKRFRVVGILTGADENAEASKCLREKINVTEFESFAQLTPAKEDSYKIILAVQEARAAD